MGAFDQDAHYPAIVPPDFASGTIKSDADPDLCVDGKLHSMIMPISVHKRGKCLLVKLPLKINNYTLT